MTQLTSAPTPNPQRASEPQFTINMAQDSDKPTAADKGKGKAAENGKPDDVPKDKDGKPLPNGKKADEKDEGMRRHPTDCDRRLTRQTF